MPISVSKSEVESMLEVPISGARWSAAATATTRTIDTYLPRGVNTASITDPDDSAIIDDVFVRVVMRALTNPSATASVGIGADGSHQASFGDAVNPSPFALRASERELLDRVGAASGTTSATPSVIRLRW